MVNKTPLKKRLKFGFFRFIFRYIFFYKVILISVLTFTLNLFFKNDF